MILHELVHAATFAAVLVFFVALISLKAIGEKSPRFELAWILFFGFSSGLYVASGAFHYLFIVISLAAVEILSQHYEAASPK
jgi:hypothetical protein